MHVIKAAGLLAAFAAFTAVPSAGLCAQGARPLTGSVAPGAVGAPAPTATPIGGLKTVPIPKATPRVPGGTGVGLARGAQRLPGMYPLVVADAPYLQRGVVVSPGNTGSAEGYRGAYWTPTAERPQWVRDTTVAPVQAWRDLIVADVVCNAAAECVERRQRVRAPWIATCGCYAFADGLNRIWRVE